MAELDEHMRELAKRSLSKSADDWRAYMLLDVAERRLAHERELYGADATEPRTDGVSDFAVMARDYIATGDGDRLRECIGAAQATISELHAASSGECRKRIEDWARSLSSML